MQIQFPANDAEHVAALQNFGILEAEPEQAFDDLAELAAQICDCPFAGINPIDETRMWRLASVLKSVRLKDD